jgi:hypothetical protein
MQARNPHTELCETSIQHKDKREDIDEDWETYT